MGDHRRARYAVSVGQCRLGRIGCASILYATQAQEQAQQQGVFAKSVRHWLSSFQSEKQRVFFSGFS